jgi:hypothetical protein
VKLICSCISMQPRTLTWKLGSLGLQFDILGNNMALTLRTLKFFRSCDNLAIDYSQGLYSMSCSIYRHQFAALCDSNTGRICVNNLSVGAELGTMIIKPGSCRPYLLYHGLFYLRALHPSSFNSTNGQITL